MSLQISVHADVKRLTQTLDRLAMQQLPFATARALTTTMKQAVSDLRMGMEKAFDRPTTYTLNAFYAKPAKKTDLNASVLAREWAGKGTPAWKYLMPETFGGARNMKRFERALAPFSGGQFVLPARGSQLDAYGNISRGQIVQVLSRLKAMHDPAQNASDKTVQSLRRKGLTVASSGHRSDYFIAKSKSDGRPLGVYHLVSKGHVEPVMFFTPKTPTYAQNFPFEQIVVSSVQKHFSLNLKLALRDAIKTAR